MSQKLASFTIPIKTIHLKEENITLDTLSFRLVYDKGDYIIYGTLVKLEGGEGYKSEISYPYSVKMIRHTLGTVGRTSRKSEMKYIGLAAASIAMLEQRYKEFYDFELNLPAGGYTEGNVSEFFTVYRPNVMDDDLIRKFLPPSVNDYIEKK